MLKTSLRKMEIGQSIRFNETDMEYVKTKEGFKSTKGFKYKQKELVEMYKDAKHEYY